MAGATADRGAPWSADRGAAPLPGPAGAGRRKPPSTSRVGPLMGEPPETLFGRSALLPRSAGFPRVVWCERVRWFMWAFRGRARPGFGGPSGRWCLLGDYYSKPTKLRTCGFAGDGTPNPQTAHLVPIPIPGLGRAARVVCAIFSKSVMGGGPAELRSKLASLCSIGQTHPFAPTCRLAERRAQPRSRLAAGHRRRRRAAVWTAASTVLG
jgi:hypothetical protein